MSSKKKPYPSFFSTLTPTVSSRPPLDLTGPSCAEFEINEETREYLKKLKGPLGVLSVAGMYRSGKSYLLNRVLLNRSRGFDVGHTINACTKVSHFIKEL